MKYLCTLLLAFLLSPTDAFAQAHESDGKCVAANEQTAKLISRYQELRERRRSSSDGEFDKDLDAHDGKLHQVLAALGNEFRHPPNTKQNIIACLGEPDAIRSDDHMRRFLAIYQSERRKAGRQPLPQGEREYLIYFWRGWHDFLFFINEDGRIIDSGWWFAYE